MSGRKLFLAWRWQTGLVDLPQLERTLEEAGEPPYRARQVWLWLAGGAGSFAEMTNLSLELRRRLARGEGDLRRGEPAAVGVLRAGAAGARVRS